MYNHEEQMVLRYILWDFHENTTEESLFFLRLTTPKWKENSDLNAGGLRWWEVSWHELTK